MSAPLSEEDVIRIRAGADLMGMSPSAGETLRLVAALESEKDRTARLVALLREAREYVVAGYVRAERDEHVPSNLILRIDAELSREGDHG